MHGNTTHGHASAVNGCSRTYRAWRNMRTRCENPNSKIVRNEMWVE